MHVPLNRSFNTLILSSRSGRSDELFQPANIKKDELAPSICDKEEMEAEVLDTNLEIEEEDRKIQFNLRLQHARKIIKI